MAERAVYQTRKDQFGNIIALGGQFGVVPHSEAIIEIGLDTETYYVPLQDGSGILIEVAEGQYGKYLRANWDGQGRNNLVDLPDC